MKTSSLRIAVLVAIIAPFLVFHPTIARAATVTVMVGPGGFFFTPSSVTIHTGDTVVWTWSSGGHSSTSGSPGMPGGLWDSGILNQGATFMHTFNTAGSFPYYCTVHGACCGMVGTVSVSNSTPTPTPSRLGNISTRASVQTGDQVLIAGFILTGTDPKQVIVRGLGPTLGQPPFNVPNALQNPVLELHLPTSVITNDDWQSAANANQIPTSPVDYRPPNSLESAILITLQPGAYTAIMSGTNSTTGNGLVEVYDLATSTFSQLTNVSTRGFVGTGDNRMIGGFITSGGNGSTQVVMRGLGPTLGQPPFNLSGVLADPFLTLVDGNGMTVQNNNWKDTQQAAIQAASCNGSTCAPPNDLEAAILITVPPGNYTAILEGNGGGTGIGLVEVYKLP